MDVRLNEVKNRIIEAADKSDRNPTEVKLIAVSKTRTIEEIDKLNDLGFSDFGENRVQELERKIGMRPDYKWHMIGSLQSNKVKYIIDKVELIHSLDRKSLAKELDKRAKMDDLIINTLVQVNVSGENSKSGMSPNKVMDFFEFLSTKSNINVVGLMTMAPYTKDELVLRKVFSGLRKIRDKVNKDFYGTDQLIHLSMGMSNDFEIAIEEGSTMVRIGSAIFGEYNY